MQPPPEGLERPTGDVVPYPNTVLRIPGSLFVLTRTAKIVPRASVTARPVDLNPQTYNYWEGRAQAAGTSLSELMG